MNFQGKGNDQLLQDKDSNIFIRHEISQGALVWQNHVYTNGWLVIKQYPERIHHTVPAAAEGKCLRR